MLTTARDRDPFAARHLPPARWAFPSREIEDWARQARAETLREMFAWLARQTLAVAMRWIAGYQAWRTRREAVRELQSLDNRMLRDMGIGRSEIEWRVADGDESRVTQRPAVVVSKPCAAATARWNQRHEAEKRAA